MNKQLSDSQFQKLVEGTKKALDWKTILQFIVYIVMLSAAFFTLRERVSLCERDIQHLEQRVEKTERL